MFAGAVFASDTTGISDLDTQATAFKTAIMYLAKYGGIALIVIMGLMVGFGKAQGQTATLLCSGAIAIGLISAAWGWFGESFAHGFVF